MAEEQKTQKAGPENKRQSKDDNIVYVGKKPTMSYVLAVMTQLQSGQADVHVKARGRNISRAVDVVEAVKNKFMSQMKREISIATESVRDKENRPLNISIIDIKVTK